MRTINDINIKQWESKSFEGLKLTNTRYSEFEFSRHFHNYYTFMLIKEGANEGFTNNSSYKIGMESLLIINPGDIHAGKSYNKNFLNFYSFRADRSFVKSLLTKNGFDLGEDVIFSTRPIPVKKYSRRIHSLIRAIKKNNYIIELNSLLTDLFILLINDHNVNGKNLAHEKIDYSYLAKAKKYIEENYQESFELENLSEHCNISAYHLIRQFQNRFGLTPFEYLRNFRIERAKELMHSNVSITEVAHLVGFYDHSHFLRNFKKITGMLPSQYQKQAS